MGSAGAIAEYDTVSQLSKHGEICSSFPCGAVHLYKNKEGWCMRKPVNWRAPFMVRANSLQPTSKQNFPFRSVFSTLALSVAVASFAAPGVSLAEAAEDIKP